MIGFDRNVMVVVTLGLRRVGRALPGLVLALALGIAVVLLAAPVAFAYDRPTDLRRVASIFAMRDAEVRCPSSAEWIADPIWGTGPNPSRAWGYTDMIEEYIVLHPALCARGAGRLRRAASAVAAGDGGTRAPTRGLPRAPLEMAPERGQVECQAIRHFTIGAQLLGASPALANELLPFALAAHARMVTLFPEYRDRTCMLPMWALPMSP